MSTTTKAEARAEAAEILHKLCPPGSTVYTVLRHVSKSGMSRDIDAYVMEDGAPRWITGYACTAAGFTRKGDHARVSGCGMDMGFHLVYELSARLYPQGFGCVGEGCPSNDHSNGDRDYTPHRHDADRMGADGQACTCCRTHWHRDGGYALKQRWI